MTSYFCIPVPYNEKDIFLWLLFLEGLVGLHRSIQLELLIAKYRLKLKKVGKTTRPFKHDLNQIPYDYTVEVRNRFKGLDLIDRVPDELWMEVCDIVQRTGIKTIPMEKKGQNQKVCLGRPYK